MADRTPQYIQFSGTISLETGEIATFHHGLNMRPQQLEVLHNVNRTPISVDVIEASVSDEDELTFENLSPDKVNFAVKITWPVARAPWGANISAALFVIT